MDAWSTHGSTPAPQGPRMSITPVSSSTTSTTSSRTERSGAAEAGVAATLAGIATAAGDGVSATVSLSSKALHALEHAGEEAVDAVVDGGRSVAGATSSLVDGVEDVAVGAWHAAQGAAHELEHAGEAVANAIGEGVQEVVSVGKALGHYAAVGLSATGEALSEVASGTVMAAAAGGKAVAAMI